MTGSNAGIGFETCKGLLKAGFHVVVCARRLKAAGSAVTSNALHPGNVDTALWSKIGRSNGSGIPVDEGALTSIYVATSKELQGQSVGYFFLSQPVTTI